MAERSVTVVSDEDEKVIDRVGLVNLTPESTIDTDEFAHEANKLKSYEGTSPVFKRRVTNELKKYQRGADGAATKQIIETQMFTGYDAFDVIVPPYNLDYLARIYELSPPHYAAVNAKVANIVGLGYKLTENRTTKRNLERISSDVNRTTNLRRKLDQHRDDLLDNIESWNEEDTFTEVLIKVWRDYEVTGNGYIEVGRKLDGTIGYIGHVPSQTIRIRRKRDGFIQICGFKVQFFANFGHGDDPNPIANDKPNEIIHIKKYSPTSGYYGIPDIIAAKEAVAGNKFASAYNLEYFENKAVPRYLITLKGARLGAQAEARLLTFFETSLKGQNHRSLFIPLPPDTADSKVEFNIEPIESSVQDSSFENYRKGNLFDILMAHRVPLSKINTAESASLAIAKDADKTFKEQVCLAGETLVMTPEGDVPIRDLSGKDATLLVKDFDEGYSGSKWVEAPIKSFGEQRLWKISMTRNGESKDIYATAEHRWFVKKTKRSHIEETTETLTVGDVLLPIRHRSAASRIKNFEYGVPSGIVFGDGHLNSNGSAGIELFGSKDYQLLKFFPYGQQGPYHVDREEGFCTRITGLPRAFKSFPSLNESTGYLYGFLAGWFAADGTVRRNGSACLYSISKDNLEYAKLIARRIGINTYSITTARFGGNEVNGNMLDARDGYKLTFVGDDLAESFFLIDEHRSRWNARSSDREMVGWKISSVEPTNRVEEVFCAVVDGIGNFALADNILTGNCGPEQRVFEKKLNRMMKELTDAFDLRLNEMTLTDEDTQSKIFDVYRKNGVMTANEVRMALGMTTIEGGNELFDMNAKSSPASQAAADVTTIRQRDTTRAANATDSAGNARNPKGEGRTTP